MPQRIYCSSCGRDLYVGIELESPLETIHKHGGFCPACRSKLRFDVDSIKIVPVEDER
ncbi:MAG: hypothetical protein QXO25_02690 [Candidatus Bathyarchaeia archaeon]